MLHPMVKLMDKGVIEGKGLVAQGLIRTGEIVSRLEPDQPMVLISEVINWPEDKQDELLHYGYQCDAHHIVSEQGDEKYMNHSCDPNTWWVDDNTMVARRDIQPGEEITYDYATTEITIPFVMFCHCGAEICRCEVTNLDYQNSEWQARFGKHLPQHVLDAISDAKAE